jgi:hypothetical protein
MQGFRDSDNKPVQQEVDHAKKTFFILDCGNSDQQYTVGDS